MTTNKPKTFKDYGIIEREIINRDRSYEWQLKTHEWTYLGLEAEIDILKYIQAVRSKTKREELIRLFHDYQMRELLTNLLFKALHPSKTAKYAIVGHYTTKRYLEIRTVKHKIMYEIHLKRTNWKHQPEVSDILSTEGETIDKYRILLEQQFNRPVTVFNGTIVFYRRKKKEKKKEE